MMNKMMKKDKTSCKYQVLTVLFSQGKSNMNGEVWFYIEIKNNSAINYRKKLAWDLCSQKKGN